MTRMKKLQLVNQLLNVIDFVLSLEQSTLVKNLSSHFLIVELTLPNELKTQSSSIVFYQTHWKISGWHHGREDSSDRYRFLFPEKK